MLWCSGAVRWPTLERYRLLLAKFKACKDLWLGAARLAQQDGRVGVVLLHGGVRLCEEAPTSSQRLQQGRQAGSGLQQERQAAQ